MFLQENMVTNLSELDPSKVNVSVRVRVSRMLLYVAHNGVLQACNLILLDEEVCSFANYSFIFVFLFWIF